MAEDYETGKVNIDDLNGASSYGIENVDSEIIRDIFIKGAIDENGILGDKKEINGYYILKNGKTFDN